MPDEKTLGLNSGEEKTPGANGQAQNNASDSATNPDELEGEVDKILGQSKDDDDNIEGLDGDDGEDTVVLPKKKVQQILRDKKNYKDGLLSVKGKLKGFKKPAGSPAAEAKPQPKADDSPLTRGEFQKSIDKQAIDEAINGKLSDADSGLTAEQAKEISADLNDNWADVMKFFSARHDQSTVVGRKKDILDAYTLYRKNNPKTSGDDTGKEKKDDAAKLVAEKGKPAGQKGEGKPQERKSILTKKTPVQEWYK